MRGRRIYDYLLPLTTLLYPLLHPEKKKMWAATWQNQQNECAPSEDSDQPGHPPSLIRVFAVRMMKAWVLSYPLSAQQRLWSDWADAQADLSLRWAHSHFVGFVMSRLNCTVNIGTPEITVLIILKFKLYLSYSATEMRWNGKPW